MVSKKQRNYLDVVWDNATIGNMIASLRQCDDLSQTELAAKVGVSKQFLSNVENNKKTIGIKFIQKIADALDYPVEPFLELLVRDQIKKEGLKVQVKITAVS